MNVKFLSGLKEYYSTINDIKGGNVYYQNDQLREYVFTISRALKKNNKKYEDILTYDFQNRMYHAAQIHDIGKICVPGEIMLKEGKLTLEEYEEVKKHVIYGIEILNRTKSYMCVKDDGFFSVVLNMVSMHHEWWDGTGYPFGRKGEEIPIEGRIMAVADVYDALRSERVYKKAYSHEKAIGIIMSESGTHFDPDVVEALLRCESVVEMISDSVNDEICLNS